ncbi:MAG TPA: DUF6754 domain-containing protein [Anaerolineales bacterium]|nr:DUF6754 domain-containing protein [Anaerolineales bacterium]
MIDPIFLEGLLGFGVIMVTAALLAIVSMLRRKSTPSFREIPAYTRLKRAIGRVVEDGTRLHVSLGHAALPTPQSASAFAGLTLLKRLAELTSAGDQPPITTSGDTNLTILSQDTLQTASQASAQGVYDPLAGRLTGLTPFSYAAGALPVIRDENISANVLMGNFGVEAALLTDAAERANTFTLASSDNLATQAVLYASAQEAPIGEELFAAGAYVEAGSLHTASLTAQDILRWIIIVIILVGALLKLFGFNI